MSATMCRRMANWVVRLLLLALVGSIAFAISVLVILPRATHGVALDVLSGSMTPTIPVGSIVLDRPVDPGTLHVGDIATYQKAPGSAEYITHRIVKIDTSKNPAVFTFKGDANRGADIQPVPATAIRGKVWFHVPYLGAIRDAVHTKGGLAGIGMLVLGGYALVQLAVALKDRRKRPGNPPAVAPERPAFPSSPAELAQRLTSQLLIVATMPIRAFDGLSPHLAAALFRGILLDSTDVTFTMLIAADADRVQRTLALLQRFEPISLQTETPEERAQSRPARQYDDQPGVVDDSDRTVLAGV